MCLWLNIEKLYDSRGYHWGPGTMKPQASWFVEPWWLPHWQLCNFSIAVGSRFYPMTHENEGQWVVENNAIPKPLFSTGFETSHGIKKTTHVQHFNCYCLVYVPALGEKKHPNLLMSQTLKDRIN